MGALALVDKVFGSRIVLYVLLIAALIYPLTYPLGIPLSISGRTVQVYDYVKNLKPGCHVYMEIYYEVAARGELEPAVAALAKQLFDKGCKIVFGSLISTGPIAFSLLRSTAADIFDAKTYGVDYVYLGYVSGQEAAATSLAKSIKGTVSVDNYGNRIETLPLMKEIDKATDFELVIIASSGTDTFNWYVRQWYTPYNVPLLFVALSVIAPSVEPFVSAKQAIGMLTGQRSAAEYELLVGRKGLGVASMDAQSLTHALILVFIVVGNVVYWGKRLSSKKNGGGAR
ncbi:MAG: hypothetical protein QXM76_04520 [Zestosphaera sp.]